MATARTNRPLLAFDDDLDSVAGTRLLARVVVVHDRER
jgi:hypothetical protein